MKYQFLRLSFYKLFSWFISLAFIIIIHSCKDDPVTPPPPPVIPKDTIKISIADYTHRSISISINSTANNPESFIRLYRLFNSSETLLSEYPITVKDTTIIDDDNGAGLLLNTEYSYYAVRTDTAGEKKDSSNLVEAATLDTTSHNYTWQEWVIGDFQSSLYDVWGTDENNVYAVGGLEIGGNHYSVLHYDGNTWTPITDTVGGHSVFGFSSDDIWITGGGVYHLENNVWIRKDAKMINFTFHILDTVLFNNSPYTSIWGTSSSNMYFGTEWGKIIHWNGNKAIDLGINAEIAVRDIFGFSDSDIYAVAGYPVSDYTNRLYHFDGFEWSVIKEAINSNPQGNYLAKPLMSVYGKSSNDLFVAGRLIHRRLNGVWSHEGNFQFTNRIRGSSTNNIAAVGSAIHHYNGSTWKDISFTNPNNYYHSVFVTENKIFVVGSNGSNAAILIGTKN